MPRIETRDGAPLHYFDIGRGTPVVLLHGFGMDSALWLPFTVGLSHRYRFILPSLRGFGGSHAIGLSQPSVLDQHADDLADLLDHLGLEQVRLGGLSMGACTALQYHRRYGFDRIRAYLHMDQAPCVMNAHDWRWGLLGEEQGERLAQWGQQMQALEPYRGRPWSAVPTRLQRQLYETLRAFLQFAFHGRAWRAAIRLPMQVMRPLMPLTNWTIYLDVLRSYLTDSYDWRGSLGNLRTPMRALVGMESTMYPATGQLMIRRFAPQAEMVPIAGCGHAIPFDAPRRFRAELTGFLRDAD